MLKGGIKTQLFIILRERVVTLVLSGLDVSLTNPITSSPPGAQTENKQTRVCLFSCRFCTTDTIFSESNKYLNNIHHMTFKVFLHAFLPDKVQMLHL